MAMAEQKTLTINWNDRRVGALVGALLMTGAAAAVAGYIFYPALRMFMLWGWAVLGLILAAWRRPVIMYWALWAAGIYNYGMRVPGAVIKPSELVQIAMIAFTIMRLAAGDREAIERLARAGWLTIMLVLLGLMAAASAAPHPHFFNARYEIFNYATIVYGLLFFRARDWRGIVALFVVAVAAEAFMTLVLWFGYGINGLDFVGEGGGMSVSRMTADQIERFAGGKNRVFGTMAHKNMLAAFFVLLMPLVSVQMLRGRRFSWFIAVIPALVALGLTDSMTGWAALGIAIGLLLVFMRRFDYLAIVLLMVLPVLAVGIWKFGDSIFYRTQQLFGTTAGYGTVSARYEILNISLRLIEDHPWLGIGRNNFQFYGQTYYSHAHNLFLMKIVEMGIPAGAAFIGAMLAMFGRIWWAVLRQTRRLSAQGQYYHLLGATLGLTGIMAMNMLDYNYTHFSLGPMFTGLLGIALAVAMDLPGVAEDRSTR